MFELLTARGKIFLKRDYWLGAHGVVWLCHYQALKFVKCSWQQEGLMAFSKSSDKNCTNVAEKWYQPGYSLVYAYISGQWPIQWCSLIGQWAASQATTWSLRSVNMSENTDGLPTNRLMKLVNLMFLRTKVLQILQQYVMWPRPTRNFN